MNIITKYRYKDSASLILEIKQDAKRSATFDIATFSLENMPNYILSELRNTLENSNIPYFVDVVDMSKVDDEFIKQVLAEGIEANSPKAVARFYYNLVTNRRRDQNIIINNRFSKFNCSYL